ncbi:hypothetical protein UFOVP247_53 [uncultured Caudovirales phage]|uniref:Uncharacterized protein n=1 Tax=uncultured Caudovirales phage TaxID=2100421 RepID=A0A6J7WXW2_9CAUD|nr:hypothetical protein UFOVP247_53 [uncultured Caudovirales phage]
MSKKIIESYGTNYYTTYLKYDEDADEYYIQLHSDLIATLGWKEGDELIWSIAENNNAAIVRKKKENEDE